MGSTSLFYILLADTIKTNKTHYYYYYYYYIIEPI